MIADDDDDGDDCDDNDDGDGADDYDDDDEGESDPVLGTSELHCSRVVLNLIIVIIQVVWTSLYQSNHPAVNSK